MGTAMGQERFLSFYEGKPPWDIPGPQPVIARLEESGAIQGSVLDAGCGTGENALFLASRGHEVWGLDFVPAAIERAIAKAKERGLGVHFQVGDALKLDQLGRTFDTVIDCGLFHTFEDEERLVYVSGLAKVVGPGGCVHVLCFSDQEPPGEGPRRVSQQEIRDAFRDGWEIVEIQAFQFQIIDHPEARSFSPGGPKGWRATIRRADT
ncbi:MAG: class I SAM-dependent methyltransferase [Isosphaeraceae bacterium]